MQFFQDERGERPAFVRSVVACATVVGATAQCLAVQAELCSEVADRAAGTVDTALRCNPQVKALLVHTSDTLEVCEGIVVRHEYDPFDEARALERCKARLADYKVPIRVVPLDAFPVTESANAIKIRKTDLRRMADEILATENVA